MSERFFKLGTRGSPLARWQAEWVAARLGDVHVDVELVLITTKGDVKAGPLGQIGGEGLFTKEIQRALLEREIDFAVHSLKDLPTTPVEGLTLAAVPPREENSDVLVSKLAKSVAELPPNARIGTGSLRRKSQLLHQRPDLQVLEIRGNVETRLRKLDDGEYDAIVLAEAGLKRLGLADRITAVLPRDAMLPAVGQGALGIEARADDKHTLAALKQIDDDATHQAVVAERTLLATLRAGCLAPVGAWARTIGGELVLEAVVVAPDGSQRIAVRDAAPPTDAAALGKRAAEQLLAQGAEAIIRSAHA